MTRIDLRGNRKSLVSSVPEQGNKSGELQRGLVRWPHLPQEVLAAQSQAEKLQQALSSLSGGRELCSQSMCIPATTKGGEAAPETQVHSEETVDNTGVQSGPKT